MYEGCSPQLMMLLGAEETFTKIRINGNKLDYQGCAIDWDIGSLEPVLHATPQVPKSSFVFLEFYCFV